MLKDADQWCQSKLPVYALYGPPGVGKSHFVKRLAFATGLPMYRARLWGASTNAGIFAQLLSSNVLQHETILVLFDEFQSVLKSWCDRDDIVKPQSSGNVTLEGFYDFLQGSSSMPKGIVVLSGAEVIGSLLEEIKPLRRRVNHKCRVNLLQTRS